MLDRMTRSILDVSGRLWQLINLHLWGEIFITRRRDPRESLLGVTANA